MNKYSVRIQKFRIGIANSVLDSYKEELIHGKNYTAMVAREHKRLHGPFIVSKEDSMSCYLLVCMTLLFICNIEVK